MLKRIIVLALLFGMMFGLGLLTQGSSGALINASQTLASIGFTALFAFTVGEVFGALKLPRVTGYILTGIVLGPHLGEIFSSEIVSQMQMFNTLALGLIALSAGLELDMRGTWRLMKTLSVTILLKIVTLVLFVGGAFVGIEMIWSPFGLEMNQTLSVALIIATLGIGTSPAIALAILNDTGAKGRLSELLLSMAVLKDLVVVVSLAIAMAIASALLSGGGFDPHALSHVAVEIGASILAGAIIGGLTIAYIRFVHKEMLFFVVAMILAVAEISLQLHLELLLVFIVAGFLVRNFSPFEHELLHPLEVVALPVFVVFFTTAGANIDLGKTLTVLPIAIALFSARGIAFFLAARAGSVLCGESEAIKKHSWMTYLPQAGVTLGLVTIAIGKLTGGANPSEAMIQVAEVLEPLGVALVALNLLVGPVTMGVALKKSGEVPEEGTSTKEEVDTPDAPGHTHAHTSQASSSPEIEPLHEGLSSQQILLHIEELPLEELDHLDTVLATTSSLYHIAESIDQELEKMTLDVIDLFEQQLVTLFEILPNDYTSQELAEIAMQWQRHAQCGESEVHEQLDALLTRHFPELLQALPSHTLTPFKPSHYDFTSEGLLTRVRASIRDVSMRFLPGGEAAYRRVLVRQSTRAVLEPGLLAAILDWITALSNAQNTFFGAMVGALENLEPRAELLDTMQTQIDYARARARAAWRHGWARALHTLIDELRELDTPINPSNTVSYAKVEPVITERLELLDEARERWRMVHASTDAHVIARASNILAREEFQELLQEHFLLPEQHIMQELLQALDTVIQRLAVLEEMVHQTPKDEEAARLDAASLDALSAQVEQCYDANLQKRLRRLVHQHGGRQLLAELQKLIEGLVNKLPSDLNLLDLEDPRKNAAAYSLDLQNLFRQHLLSEFFVELLKEHGELSEIIAQVPSRTLEALHAVQYAMELVSRGRISREEEGLQHIQTSFSRGLKQLEEIKEEVQSNQRELEEDIYTKLDISFNQIVTDITQPPRFDGIRFVQEGLKHPVIERIEARSREFREDVRDRYVVFKHWLATLREREEVRELRIRRGIDKLSSQQMHQWIEERLPAPEQVPVDAIIHQLFSLDAVDDRRLFVSREQESEEFLSAIERWKHGEQVDILVKGETGSGKTSLIDNHLFDIGASNVYRLDRRFWYRDDGILRALAFELGAREEVDVMARKLQRGPHVVIIDALERWLSPDTSGFAQWRKVRQLMSKTPSTLWIVSTHDRFYELLDEALPWDVAFTDTIAMRRLSRDKLASVIELRHRLSGHSFDFPEPSLRQRLMTRAETKKELYYEELVRRCPYDLRAALYFHLRAMTQRRDTIFLQPPQSPSIPFIHTLRLEEQAVILSLLQFDQLPKKTLRLNLSSSAMESLELLKRLQLLGLIEDSQSHDELRIPHRLRRPLLSELSSTIKEVSS